MKMNMKIKKTNTIEKLILSILIIMLNFNWIISSHAEVQEEIIEANEEELIQELIHLAENKVKSDFAQSKDAVARRDAHPKDHGCLEAKFQIYNHIVPQYKQGVFAQDPHKIFKALIRFSNANGMRPDSTTDVRGLSLKVLNMENNQGEVMDVDFLFGSHPVFIAKDLYDYRDLTEHIFIKRNVKAYLFPTYSPHTWRYKAMKIFAQMGLEKHSNLLGMNYFSMLPYALGKDQYVKYALKPCTKEFETPFPNDPTENFLREQLHLDLNLKSKKGCFEVFIQTDLAGTYPIEDAQVQWNSPLIKVAQITFGPQEFDTKEKMESCEELSFNPWNTFEENRPVGALNRARQKVYKATSQLRKKLNSK
jgi:hypothetical protein